MTTTVKITCDACREDITYSKDGPSHRIAMYCEQVFCKENNTTLLSQAIPPFEGGPKHFCGTACVLAYFTMFLGANNP